MGKHTRGQAGKPVGSSPEPLGALAALEPIRIGEALRDVEDAVGSVQVHAPGALDALAVCESGTALVEHWD